MSDKNRPEFDKDVELTKINLLAEEWRGTQILMLGTFLSVMLGLDAVVFASEIANQTSALGAGILVAFFGAFFGSAGYLGSIRPYRKRIRRLNTLLNKIREGETIGDLDTLLKNYGGW